MRDLINSIEKLNESVNEKMNEYVFRLILRWFLAQSGSELKGRLAEELEEIGIRPWKWKHISFGKNVKM